MSYLVDTDILIDLTRNHQGAIEYIDSLRNEWSISTITGLELMVGAKNKREVYEIDLLLATYASNHVTEVIERCAYDRPRTYAN